MNPFLTRLQESTRPLVADGAMGTMLHSQNIGFDRCFDELNLSQPALVGEVHCQYIQAGAELIKTNTFGANSFKLARHGLEGKAAEINRAGVELARRAVIESCPTGREVLILGDVGPLGVHLAPFGRVQADQARLVFLDQMRSLVEAGVDAILIETMSDLNEVCEALAAARQLDVPVIASMTFTRDDRTLLGDDPRQVALSLAQAGVDCIGVNCSGGPAQLLRILHQMAGALPQDKKAPFSVMPNAGWPAQVGERIMYPAGPDYFGDYALAFWKAGARVIGGCCGTTPRHIAVMRRALDAAAEKLTLAPSAGEAPGSAEREEIRLSLGTDPSQGAVASAEEPTRLAQSLAAGKFVCAVEMDPPRGLSTHKLLAGARMLAEAGADVINVADSPMARMRMSPWAVCSLIQQQIHLETVLHFPTRGRNLLRVQGDLLAAHALGVRNLFVVMGDPTAIGDYPDAMDGYDLVPSGLIKLIKQGFNAGMDHAGTNIGQPTSFFVGCALNLNPSKPEEEMKNLRRKLKAGADFILTQPVFDPQPALAFLEQIRAELGPLTIPLLVGILPLVNARHAAFLHHEVPGIIIPESVRQGMIAEGSPEDKNSRIGIKYAIELVEELRPWVSGIYIMPAFSRFDMAAEIIETVSRGVK
jgi:homocysteine S-methyltransferase